MELSALTFRHNQTLTCLILTPSGDFSPLCSNNVIRKAQFYYYSKGLLLLAEIRGHWMQELMANGRCLLSTGLQASIAHCCHCVSLAMMLLQPTLNTLAPLLTRTVELAYSQGPKRSLQYHVKHLL